MQEETVTVPRFGLSLSTRLLSECIDHSVQSLGYAKATAEQYDAIYNFVLGRDVFVSLPTGRGKSLCYAALPVAFNRIRTINTKTNHAVVNSIVVCISPLAALMLDQVRTFTNKGLQAA